MKPEEVLEALRLAIVSGAITMRCHYSPYPATEIEMFHDKEMLGFSWTAADVQFIIQGSKHESVLKTTIYESQPNTDDLES